MDLQQDYIDKNAYEIRDRSGLDMEYGEKLTQATGEDGFEQLEGDQLAAVELVDLLDNFTVSLRGTLLENLQLRDPIENQWAEDEKRFVGEDVGYVEAKHKGQVRQVPNMTRSRVNTAESRIGDLLFSNNEKNWGISATPNPDLVSEFSNDEVVMLEDETPLTTVENNQTVDVTKAMVARRKVEMSNEACEAMERTISDQLAECDFIPESRKALHNCIKLGTGILKGPSVEFKSKTAWKKVDGVFTHEILERHVPVTHSVEPKNFVPDMSATNPEEMDFTFERSYSTKRQLRKLLKEKELIPGQVKRLLNMSGSSTQTRTDRSRDTSREHSNLQSVADDNRYEIWEYTGELSKEIVMYFGSNFDPDEYSDIEELEGLEGKIWFSGNIALKITINPMAEIDGEIAYAIVCYEDDPACVFGRGLCQLGKNTQDAMVDAFSAMMDNMDKTAGVQVIRSKGLVTGADGDDDIKRNKVWEADRAEDVTKAFHVFEFPNNQADCERVYQVLRELFDEEVQVPAISGGDQGTASPTFGGMAMLMNSVGAIFRQLTKSWDDSITDRLITWFYNWNMNFSDDDSIKGDFEVIAKGSSTLLVKEMVNQSILALFQMSQSDPEIRNRVKIDGLLKHWIKNNHLPIEDAYRTDDEIQALMEKQQKESAENADAQGDQEQGVTPEQLKVMQLEDRNAERELKLYQIQSNEQLQLSIMAQNTEMKHIDLQARQKELSQRHQIEREKLQVDYKKFQMEAKIKMATGRGI